MRGTIYSKLLNSSEPIKWGQLWRLFRKLKTGHMWKHPVLCLVEGKSLSAPRPSGPQFPHEMIPLSQGFCEGCLTECLGKPLWTGKWCKDTNFFFFHILSGVGDRNKGGWASVLTKFTSERSHHSVVALVLSWRCIYRVVALKRLQWEGWDWRNSWGKSMEPCELY